MLAAAAVCPSPPLLVPQVAAGAAAELDELRDACTSAITALAMSRLDRLVVVGAAASTRPFPAGTPGSFRGFGVPVDVRLGGPGAADSAGERLPAALTVGAWLLERAGWDAAPVDGLGVASHWASEDCLRAGRELAKQSPRIGLLVMGDGTACRTSKAPGSFDERAEEFDAAAARAFDTVDTEALATLDPVLAAELRVEARASWQVLAGAATGAGLTGRLLYDEAPYGVGYLVASWS